MSLSGLVSFLVSIFLALTSGVYFIATLVYALIKKQSLKVNPLRTHLLGSITALALSAAAFIVTTYAGSGISGLRKHDMDEIALYYGGAIIIAWLGMNWFLGSAKHMLPVVAAVIGMFGIAALLAHM